MYSKVYKKDANWLATNYKLCPLETWVVDTSNVTDMGNMFAYLSRLKEVFVLDKWTTSAVTSSGNMFITCNSIVGGAGTKYNSSYIDKTYARIDGGTSSPGYFIYKASS